MLQAYFGDSGTHDGSPAVAVAGYLSSQERWRAFDQEWKEALDAYGIEFFRMTDFASRQKQFKDWPPDKCESRLRKLIQTINRHVEFSIVTVVPAPTAQVARALDSRATGFQIAARECTVKVAEYARTYRIKGRIDFIFESGTRGSGILRDAYDRHITDEIRERNDLGPLRFDDKKCCRPLQAADIFAYELYKEIPRYLGMEHRRPRTRELELLMKPPHAWHFARGSRATP